MRFNGFLWIFLGILGAIQQVQAFTEYEILEVLKEFADSYMAPANAEIARSINATLFAENVKGTADVSTNFDGRELSTEYIFGLFVNSAAERTEPVVFGLPTSYNVTHALVQHNTVSAGLVIMFEYPVLNKSFPIEIEAFLNINEQRQITEYDVSFRRWAWATDTIIPQLLPLMAQRAGVSANSNQSAILREYMSQVVCNASLASCNGSNEHYDSYQDCRNFLSTIDVGEFYRMGEDNIACRYLHTGMLKLRPSVHCAHVGKSGGDMCIPRDYSDVVLASHFPQGFLAPKYVTPENKHDVQDIYVTNGTALNPLLEMSLSEFDYHSWDPTFFATWTFVFLLFLFACSKVLYFLYERFNKVFRLLRPDLQINVVMYTMNIFFTGVALILELASTPVFANTDRLWELQVLRVSGAMICALYCFELIYRHDMRLPLVAHHILTIFAIAFTVTVFEYTQALTFMRSAIIWLFQATTEQPIFLGLMGYRLNWSPKFVARLLKWSALQALIVKCGSAIALIIFWGASQSHFTRPIDRAWSAMVWIIALGLMATQFWGSYITYLIGRRVEKKSSTNKATIETGSDDPESEAPSFNEKSKWRRTLHIPANLDLRPSTILPSVLPNAILPPTLRRNDDIESLHQFPRHSLEEAHNVDSADTVTNSRHGNGGLTTEKNVAFNEKNGVEEILSRESSRSNDFNSSTTFLPRPATVSKLSLPHIE